MLSFDIIEEDDDEKENIGGKLLLKVLDIKDSKIGKVEVKKEK
jgi:hypothetical protein